MREGSGQWTAASGRWTEDSGRSQSAVAVYCLLSTVYRLLSTVHCPLAFLTLLFANSMWVMVLPGVSPLCAAEREWLDRVEEIQLSAEELQKLDAFEAHSIGTADKVFGNSANSANSGASLRLAVRNRDGCTTSVSVNSAAYRRAAAEYESFIQEFPRSKAIPYALVRKARCLHLEGKRYEAIKRYGEVLDLFANSATVPKYAAAALFFTGLCHWENGDDDKAVQAWTRLADDEGYSKEPLAAWALNRLADFFVNSAATGRPDKAAGYYQQVAANFRRSNPQAANYAIAQIVTHYVHAKPDEPALRAFYQKVGGFGPVPMKTRRPPEGGTPNEDVFANGVEESRPYWQAVRMAVHQNGRFPETEAELRARYYTYWAGVLRGAGVPPASVELAGKMPAPHSGRFPDWDDYQIDAAYFQLMADLGSERVRVSESESAGDRESVKELQRESVKVRESVKELERESVKVRESVKELERESVKNKRSSGKADSPTLPLSHAPTSSDAPTLPRSHASTAEEKWMQRLDAQFDRYQKPDDLFANSRVIRWIRVFRNHKPKVMQYYGKLVFEKMTNGQIRELMAAFFDEIRDAPMARNLFAKLRLGELSDDDKVSLARYLWPKDGALVEDTCKSMTDKELGQAELLRFYHSQKDAAKGVPLANVLATVPRFAKEALFKKAQLLQAAKKFSESIQAYQQADSPPESLWGIAECYAKMGKVEQAVAQLREVESFFKDHAAEAALRIARLYNETGKDKLYIAALRSVLKKYPESGQSSEAHQLLERLGIKIGGGLDAD